MVSASWWVLLLGSLLVWTALAGTLHKRVRIRKPNIIIFLVDDVRASYTGS